MSVQLRPILDQMIACARIISDGKHADPDDDPISSMVGEYYGWEGLEFELMRAYAATGDPDSAVVIHERVGAHSPEMCPVCSPDSWKVEYSAPAEVRASSADAGRSAVDFGMARVSGAEDRARVAREDRAAEVRLRGLERVAELEKEANRGADR